MSWTQDRLALILEWQKERKWENFVDENLIHSIIEKTKNPNKNRVLEVIEKAKSNANTGTMLSLEETATLLNNKDKELDEEIFRAANYVKREIYGSRIVLFSPIYIASPCVNDCKYCGFRASNNALAKKNTKI